MIPTLRNYFGNLFIKTRKELTHLNHFSNNLVPMD